MTVQPRGARNRRSGRKPGWLLLTALLVLAILASATLVFTTRVELLRLAVILSLWAAVLAAFVSVIYRRQSEADQARARDMKFVYDLQLDREITARREYELNVEAQLRRQLSREIRAQAADELAGLRAEVAALRSNLEVMLGTDLGVRPAIAAEPMTMAMRPPPGRVQSSRVTAAVEDSVSTGVIFTESPGVDRAVVETAVVERVVVESVAVDNPIIDVPEEPLAPSAPAESEPPSVRGGERADVENPGSQRWTGGHDRQRPAANRPPAPPFRPGRPGPSEPTAPWRPPETSRGRHRTGEHGGPAQVDPAKGKHQGEPGDRGGQAANAGRHRPAAEQAHEVSGPEIREDSAPEGQHAGGQSLTDLMAKLQVNRPVDGGGRRRRAD